MVEDICSFLDIQFDVKMLENKAAGRVGMTGFEGNKWSTEHKRNATSEINTGSLDKWKIELSECEVRIIESLVGQEMKDYDYRRKYKNGVRKADYIWFWCVSECRYFFTQLGRSTMGGFVRKKSVKKLCYFVSGKIPDDR